MSTTTRRRKSISTPSGSRLLSTRCSNQWMMIVAVTILMVLAYPVSSSANSLALTGNNCVVKEPLYNITFNLTTLDSDLAHHVKSDINEQFLFDVCDQLNFPCNNIPGGAACLKRNDKSQVLLGMRSTLQLTDGRIHFNFTGGEPCRNGKNYSLDIILMCSYSSAREHLSVIPYSTDQCNYYIFWTTSLACAPLPDRVKANECAVKDATGHTFNLLPLSHNNHHVDDRNGSYFSVTVCKPVHYGHMTMCPPGSSVCFVNKTESDYRKRYHDFGQTDPNPTLEGDKLVMNLNSSEGRCQNSKIIFECDLAATEEPPQYVGKEGCVHLFVWRTSLACKKKEFCAVVDPISGVMFNMSSLANRSYSAKEGNMSVEFEICKTANSQCPDTSGACQLTNNNSQAVSLGSVSDELLYNITGAPYLLYQSGAICSQTKKWTTKIEFICETDKGDKSQPKLVEYNNCEVVIQMETELACNKEISCIATNPTNDLTIDLSSLISAQTNYKALVNDTLAVAKEKQFYLNVCRPLLSTYGLGCPGGSAACMAVQGPKDPTPKEELSLGYPDVSLTMVGDRAQLRYLRGSVCPQDNATELSTEVEFYCKPKAGRGVPMLQEIMHDCHYRFEWATNVMCPQFGAEFRQKSCEIFSNETEVSVDLKKFFASGELLVSANKNSGSQELRDGKVQICAKNLTVVSDYREQAVTIFFTIGDSSCEETGGNINVNLRVQCGSLKGLNVNQQSPCHLILTQVTPEICAFVSATPTGDDHPTTTAPPSPSAGSTTVSPASGTTLGISTSTEKTANNGGHEHHEVPSDKDGNTGGGGSVGIILAVLTLISLAGAGGFMLLRNPERRDQLRSLFRRRNVLVSYSRVRSNDEANMLMNPTASTDSDDEMLI